MNKYSELKNKHQKEFDTLPIFFAFNNKQFAEGMEKFGLLKTEMDKIFKIPGGGFMKKTDINQLKEFFNRSEKEMSDAVKNDTTGEGFIFDMFSYELSNHEFLYTGSTEDALDALGLTQEDIDKDPILQNGLELGILEQRRNEP